MPPKRYLQKICFLGITVLIIASLARAETIELGMSTALSGPNQLLGQAMYQGMKACFDETNRRGGIRGRKINLTVLDDGYEPDNVLTNTLQLIDQQKVIAIVGNAGTPTAAISAPLANSRGVVFYGAFTGADLLRKTPSDPYVFNFRASYRQEMEVIVRDIINQGISPKQIALFLQDDSLGQTGFEITKAALEKTGFHQNDQLLVTRYPRNTLAIQSAIEALVRAQPEPEAIIIVGAYQPIAQFIRFAHRIFPNTRFYNLSFAGASLLSDALEGIQGRIYMTQVVPPAATASTENAGSTNFIWREGYFAAQVLVKALENIDEEITSDQLKTALNSLGTFYLEDFGVLSLGSNDHQASDLVWLTRFDHSLKWQEVRSDRVGK